MKTLILFFILPIFFLNGNNKFINDNSEKSMYLRAFNKIYESLVSEAKIKTKSDILISDKYAPFQMKQLLNTSSLFEENKLSNAIDSISKSSEILINNCICKSSDSLFNKIKNLVKSKQYVVFFSKICEGYLQGFAFPFNENYSFEQYFNDYYGSYYIYSIEFDKKDHLQNFSFTEVFGN